MKNIRVQRQEVFVITFTNAEGKRVKLPVYRSGKRWLTFGSYQVFGVSKDPTYSAVHALPYRWMPKGKLLAVLRKVM